MPPLHALLFILTLFLLRPAYTATPEQNEQGRIPGSLSGPHTGDWFIDTRCHCIAQNMTTTTKVGHVYQWEYYNFHTNTTFILLSIWDFIAGNGWCRNYPTDPATKENDQLCFYYKWMIDGDWHYVDYMKFNGQMRGLAEEQNQGYTQTPTCRSMRIYARRFVSISWRLIWRRSMRFREMGGGRRWSMLRWTICVICASRES